MQEVIDFMGDENVWKFKIPNIVIKYRKTRHSSKYPTAFFIDSHWTARKPYESKIFNSYDHYQKPGTHRFCQTFAMMHLLDVLPPPTGNYKSYDRDAKKFINLVLKMLPKDHSAFSYCSFSKLLCCVQCV